jgi:hypothetical protein
VKIELIAMLVCWIAYVTACGVMAWKAFQGSDHDDR